MEDETRGCGGEEFDVRVKGRNSTSRMKTMKVEEESVQIKQKIIKRIINLITTYNYLILYDLLTFP